MFASIFLEFNLPNATSWFYFSWFLVVALYFKFHRLLSLRNWDLMTLFLLVPGFLLLKQAHGMLESTATADVTGLAVDQEAEPAHRLLFAGYIWLLAGSGYWLLRCFVDLALVRRPMLTANLETSGLAWLAAALFICLCVVAVRRDTAVPEPVGKEPVVFQKVHDRAANTVVSLSAGSIAQEDHVRFWITRGSAMVCHLAIVIGLLVMGAWHFQEPNTGVACVALYLLLPYTGYHAAQVHHVWPAALLLWALIAYRQPGMAGGLLGVTAGFAFFPLLLFPLWCGFYRTAGLRLFVKGFATAIALSWLVSASILLIDGHLAGTLQTALSLSDWQPWKIPSTESIWTGAHWAYRMPVFVAYLAMLLITAFWPTPKQLAHLLAQSAAVLIGIQFWYADQGGVYVLWYLPLVILMVFRPNLSDAFPPMPPEAEQGWHRWADRVYRRIRKNSLPVPGMTQPAQAKVTFRTDQEGVRIFPPA